MYSIYYTICTPLLKYESSLNQCNPFDTSNEGESYKCLASNISKFHVSTTVSDFLMAPFLGNGVAHPGYICLIFLSFSAHSSSRFHFSNDRLRCTTVL